MLLVGVVFGAFPSFLLLFLLSFTHLANRVVIDVTCLGLVHVVLVHVSVRIFLVCVAIEMRNSCVHVYAPSHSSCTIMHVSIAACKI